MEKNKNIQFGAQYGLLIGLLYIILIFLRWTFASNFFLFAFISFISYIIILGLLLFEGFQRRKISSGSIDLKNLFQTLFISVIIFELIFSVYTYIHLTLIDPNAIEKMKLAMIELLDKAPKGQISDQQREESLKKFDEMKKATELTQMLKSYLISISISGFFAFLFSFFLKKNKNSNGMPQSM